MKTLATREKTLAPRSPEEALWVFFSSALTVTRVPSRTAAHRSHQTRTAWLSCGSPPPAARWPETHRSGHCRWLCGPSSAVFNVQPAWPASSPAPSARLPCTRVQGPRRPVARLPNPLRAFFSLTPPSAALPIGHQWLPRGKQAPVPSGSTLLQGSPVCP